METTMSFWDRNKVFIIGLILALIQVVTAFTANTTEAVQWGALGYAALSTALLYVARNWRGQTTTIVAAIITTLGVAGSQIELGAKLNDIGFILGVLGAFLTQYLAAQTPDAKSRGYEQAPSIVQAKKIGEDKVPAALTAKP